jgi:predicted lipid-binding transport protein (Tim44 family)
MLHQRNILKIYYFFAAIGILALSGVIGSGIAAFLIVIILSLPIIFVIKKIFPAPEWYVNEAEGSGVTSMNISSRNAAPNTEQK